MATPCKTDLDPQAVPAKATELLYVWINQDETGFMKQTGFNFCPNYTFTMTYEYDGRYRLTCTEDQERPNVWKTDTIVNLTAVVGENGTGKTSLLKHLVNAPMLPVKRNQIPEELFRYDASLTDLDELRECATMVQIYRNGNSIRIIHNFDGMLFINSTNFDACHVSELAENDTLLQDQTRIYMSNAFSSSKSIWDPIRKQKPIIFSPTGNYARADIFFKKVCGLNLREEPDQPEPEDTESKAADAFCYLQEIIASHKNYKDFESLCAVNYYHHLHSGGAADAPMLSDRKDLTIGLANFYNLTYQAAIDTSSNSKYQKSLRSVRRIYKDTLKQAIHERQICPMLSMYREHELRYLVINEVVISPDSTLLRYYTDAKKQIAQLESILRNCGAEQADLNRQNGRSAAPRIRLRYGSESYREFCKFISQQMRQNDSFILKYLTIEIPPHSSGEQALQNVFSWLRLPPSFKEIFGEESISIGKSILLLLDEVDLYIHPEWQRQFLHTLSERLHAEYPGKHIQVVISTHSPLILSDIPSGNVIYLEKDKTNDTVRQRSVCRETFGANLFSLLKDSFFLERSIGEFARRKIDEIITDLARLKETPDDPELRKKSQGHRQVIGIIGEPMLRGKLLSLYEEALGKDSRTRELEKLSLLLNRLQESDDPEDRKLYLKLLKKMDPEKQKNETEKKHDDGPYAFS